MTTRITRKMIDFRIKRLNAALGTPLGPYKVDESGKIVAAEGCYCVDHNAAYGGYALNQMQESGGESRILDRMPAREFYSALGAMLLGIELARKENK